MTRRLRPSDVYRLPEQRPSRPRVAEPEPPPPPRPLPRWVVAGAVAALLLVVVGSSQVSSPSPYAGGPLVDLDVEDEALAVLALFDAQASAATTLRQRRDPLAAPGPADAATVADDALDRLRAAMDAARRGPSVNPLAARYVANPGHVLFERRLEDARDTAAAIAVLEELHQAGPVGYEGAGDHDPQLRQQATRLRASTAPLPLRQWADQLLSPHTLDPQAAADEARDESRDWFAGQVEALRPAAQGTLRNYLESLPPSTIRALRDHPVGGPALARLPIDG